MTFLLGFSLLVMGMTLTNGMANGHWKEALKSSVSIAIGVILAELTVGDFHSWAAVKHTLSIIGMTTLIAELRYWQKKLAPQGE